MTFCTPSLPGSSQPTKRGHIAIKERFRLWALPCVICGDEGDIQIDHIVPLVKGGSNEPDNLQPLCKQCHNRKGNKTGRSNEDLRRLYLADFREHHLRNRYRLDTQFQNQYDRISYIDWKVRNA